jgi:hypothetical protein
MGLEKATFGVLKHQIASVGIRELRQHAGALLRLV